MKKKVLAVKSYRYDGSGQNNMFMDRVFGGGGVLRERAEAEEFSAANNAQALNPNKYGRIKSIHLQMADTVVDRKLFMK